MSSVGDLGLEESCELALDIEKSSKRTRVLPSFRPSIEETLRAACLISLIRRISGYNGVDLAEGKIARVSVCLMGSRGGGIVCLGFLSRAFI